MRKVEIEVGDYRLHGRHCCICDSTNVYLVLRDYESPILAQVRIHSVTSAPLHIEYCDNCSSLIICLTQ